MIQISGSISRFASEPMEPCLIVRQSGRTSSSFPAVNGTGIFTAEFASHGTTLHPVWLSVKCKICGLASYLSRSGQKNRDGFWPSLREMFKL